MLKAAGWPVACGETRSCRQEAVAAYIGGCLLFLEGSVDSWPTHWPTVTRHVGQQSADVLADSRPRCLPK